MAALLLVVVLRRAVFAEEGRRCRTVLAGSYTLSYTHQVAVLPFLSCCRSQTDKIFSQQSALGKAHEEAQLLREQLETRQAQQAVIEAEITRQVCLFFGCADSQCEEPAIRTCVLCGQAEYMT
jgi:hypothetical protein